MQKIRFTYKSSEVSPSVFLLLFFRMTGIYVYERFFDSGREEQEHLHYFLPEKKEQALLDESDDFDFDLFLIADKTDWEKFKSQYEYDDLANSSYRIAVFPNECGIDLPQKEQTKHYQECLWPPAIQMPVTQPMQQENALLSDIIGKMAAMKVLPKDALEDLQACQLIYNAYEIWKACLLGKYFYIAESDEQYGEIKEKYKKAVEHIFRILRANECKWGESNYIHLQYAALNMAYEGNLYCMRNNKTLLYAPQSLAHVCRMLLDSVAMKELEDSIYLLLAQIYDDLLKDSNMAYEYYLPACKEYNAYVYYRKGNYWQDYAKEYKKAIQYYRKSVVIYPEYYRAWYRIGACYMLAGRCADALEMFRNVGRILSPRLTMKKIRPMEIEYLFKAQNQCAYICNKILNNPQQSIRENFRAVEAWKAIDQSEFFDFFQPHQDLIRQRVKNQLNVSKIYYEVYLLADKIGDAQLRQEYLEKIISN